MPYLIILLLSLGLAFWLRWQFVQRINLYPDEFVTLLAMDMIGQKGAPILPSGLFYEHGLLYSYLAGGAALFGEPALMGRLTSLALGLLTIGLSYWLGQRWFSPPVGALAAVGLSLAPAAIHWHGRVRMYALLQLLVLLTILFMLEGLYHQRRKAAWLAVLSYFGALLTQFVAVVLLPALAVAEGLALQTRPAPKGWYRDRQIWLRGLAVGGAVLIAFLVKRAGQPKGLAPLDAGNAVAGVWQVLTIYTGFSPDLGASWRAISPFFLEAPVLVFTLFAPLAVVEAIYPLLTPLRNPKRRPQASNSLNAFSPPARPALFLAVVLIVTTAIVLFFAPDDRRDDKYLFMLLPALLLLGAQGMMIVLARVGRLGRLSSRVWLQAAATAVIAVGLGLYARRPVIDLLTDVGEDYAAAFAYVAGRWQNGDAVLTGTPTAAYYYLGRNDYYAVQAGGPYDYRILNTSQGPVERWLGSPWIQTPETLNAVLASRPVWLVLERWGLLIQYYRPLFMQNILAQTEFIREDNGVIVLKSLPDPRLLRQTPAVAADAVLGGVQGDSGQLKLRGYTLEGARLTLYWEALIPLRFDYTVFVNVQTGEGDLVLQTDHRPLGSIYPTTLWPPGQLIRETSLLNLPPGDYELRVGMYRLETGERMWVPSDETLQNMVYLGRFLVR